ncbi:MAG: sigma-70 family RNA polymerase sigma factor [Chlorobi bacterium]|nr:sigma-70 family RNA polymerase sigma factor [Chlorobiota bacterium]
MSAAEKIFTNLHQDLIEQCRAGDQRAQFKVYKLYYKAMYNTSLRIVNHTHEAEDIMQESFLSAFEKLDTYKGEVSFGAWLKKIVINRSLDHLRKINPGLQDMEGIGEVIDETGTFTEENNYDIGKIKSAMEKLSTGYRTILSLYLFEGYDHDEISQIMGISPSTSRSQYSRARLRLIQILKKEKGND